MTLTLTVTLTLSLTLTLTLTLTLMQAQQEAILDWTPEAKWVDFLHVRAERAEQIAQEILKPTQRRR